MNADLLPTAAPSPLRVQIHRGADEIGGNCVVLTFGDAHLIVDLGRPLGAKPGEVVPLPPIPGLTEVDPRLVGVVLSHPHEDHVGQARALAAHVPVYLGAAAERILREAMRWTPGGLDVRAAGHLEHRRPIQIGPFTVTPYRVDHSAYDAFALLIEAGGHRVFYSGDLRAHGRTGRYAELLRDGPRDVDVMLLEGTHVAPGGAHPARGPSERDVERACATTFRNAPGIAVTCFSAQNIDRLVSIFRAARAAGRELVLDLYTASIPQPGLDGLRVYVRLHERRSVIARRAFDDINAVRACRIFPEELARRRRELVIVGRDSVVPELDRAGVLSDARPPPRLGPRLRRRSAPARGGAAAAAGPADAHDGPRRDARGAHPGGARMTCDHCKNKIGPHQPETYYLCRCGTRYCHTCGHGRSKCEQCGQWNQLETRRS